MDKSLGGIYQIQHIRSGKSYVGSAVSIENRWGGHIRQLRNGRHHSAKLQRAWDKYGSETFSFSVLEFVDEPKMLLEREQYWIDFADAVKSGYNISPTAGSLLGHKFSAETKERMSRSATGHIKSPEHRASMSKANSGKKMSDESRQKMRDAKLGKKREPHSLETRAKMSAARMGIVFSDEHKSKIAAVNIGRKQSEETKRKRSESLKKTMNDPNYVNPAIGRRQKPESIARMVETQRANRQKQQAPNGAFFTSIN